MNLLKVYETCHVIARMNALLNKEGGWMLHEIVAFSNVSRSQVDRRLKQAAAWGWVDYKIVDYRGGVARKFQLAGNMAIWDGLPFEP
jgi:predicted transcriptional regulator